MAYYSVTVKYTYDSPVSEETVRILAEIAAQGAGVTHVRAFLTGNRGVACEIPDPATDASGLASRASGMLE